MGISNRTRNAVITALIWVSVVVPAGASRMSIEWVSSLDYQQFPSVLSLCGADKEIECPDKEHYRTWAVVGIWDDFEERGQLKTVLWSEDANEDDDSGAVSMEVMEPDKVLFQCQLGTGRIKPSVPRMPRETENEYGGTEQYLPPLEWKFDDDRVHEGSPRYRPGDFLSRIKASHTLVIREHDPGVTPYGDRYRFDLDGSHRALSQFENLCESARPPNQSN